MERALKVGIVVVTYNRLGCLKKCIKSIFALDYKNWEFFLIDNQSTDGTYEYCMSLMKQCENTKEHRFHYYRQNENLGGSAGFYLGMHYAMVSNVDYIWGMDDDAYPRINSLRVLIDATRRYDMEHTAFWSNSFSYLSGSNPGKEEIVNRWTFVGYFLSVLVIARIGYPRNDLFIFYDDAEYAKRLVSNGINIVKMYDSIIEHEGAISALAKNNMTEKKVFGRSIKMQNLPEWKWYYLVRNRILIEKSPVVKIRRVIGGIKITFRLGITHPQFCKAALIGIKDGILGKTGKVILPK